MAVSPIDFAYIPPPQYGGLNEALQAAMQSYGFMQKAQANKQDLAKNAMLNKALPSQLQSQQGLSDQQLQAATTNNQYLPQQLQAALLADQLKNQYYPQMTQSEIAQRLAQTELLQQQAKFAPAQHQIDQQRGNYYQALTNSLPTRYMSVDDREQALANLTDQGIPIQQGAQIAANLPQNYPINGNNANQQIMPAQGGQMQNTQASVFSPSQLSQALANVTPEARELAQKQGDNIHARIMGKNLTKDQLKRATAGDRAEIYADQLRQQLPDVSQYFGPAAQGKLTSAQIKSVMSGNAPEGLQSLDQFKRNLELYKDEAAIQLAIPADQESRGAFKSAFDLKSWYTNPELAQRSLLNIMDQVRKSGASNFKTAPQLKASYDQAIQQNAPRGTNGIKASDGKTYSLDELQRIAGGG
jgi:hypothetical protein